MQNKSHSYFPIMGFEKMSARKKIQAMQSVQNKAYQNGFNMATERIQNELQILAEIKDIVHQIYIDEELMGGAIKIKKLIDVVLKEQKQELLSKVEKMKKTDKFPQSLTTYDGKTKYFNRLSDGDLHYNKAIDDVLAKLNLLKGTDAS